MRRFFFLFVLLLALTCGSGFSVVSFKALRTSSHSSTTKLQGSSSDNDYNRGENDHHHKNDARVDVRNLLTQRAIQSFMFLCDSVRDPHSVKWMEDFLGTHGQLKYHGTGAGYVERLGGTWDAPLIAMMQAPQDVVVVSAKRRGAGHGGWSKKNPYLPERFVEFEIDINPVGLVARILSVREQIAKEWVGDLDLLKTANLQILDSYYEHAKRAQLTNDTCAISFDRTASGLINHETGFSAGDSSPFRKGNFDLLYNLCTQAAIHRLLRDLKGASFDWLYNFYTLRVGQYFDGDQKYGRADDFLEELLCSSPVITDNEIADPMLIAEEIIERRNTVLSEWKVIMENIPEEHSNSIRKELLTLQMKAWGSAPVSNEADEGFG